MKDFTGKELQIGDKIVFIATDGNSHRLRRGTVSRFETNIGTLCVIKYGNFEYKIRDTNHKIIKI